MFFINPQEIPLYFCICTEVAESGSPQQLAALFLLFKSSVNFLAHVSGIVIVHHILHRDNEVIPVRSSRIVEIIGDGDEPYTELRKDVVDIPACFHVMATEPGKVLYHNGVNPALLHIQHQTVPLGPVKTCSCESVIHVGIHEQEIRRILNVPFHQLDLVFDAFLALHGEPTIGRRRNPHRFQFFYQLLLFLLFR